MCDEDTYVVVKNYNDPSRLAKVDSREGYRELFFHVHNVLEANPDAWATLHPVLSPLVEGGLPEDIKGLDGKTNLLKRALIKSCLPAKGHKGGAFDAVFEDAHRDEPLPEFATFEDPDRRKLVKQMCSGFNGHSEPVVATLLLNWINLLKHGHHVHTTVTWKIEM